jgi:hypothetical protein
VEVVGDPDDLTVPLTYSCAPIDVPEELIDKSTAVERVRAVLERERAARTPGDARHGASRTAVRWARSPAIGAIAGTVPLGRYPCRPFQRG